MKDLLQYLLEGILGSKDFKIAENDDGGRILFTITTKDENKGMVIGKGGRMISSIRNLLKVKATLESKAVNVELSD